MNLFKEGIIKVMQKVDNASPQIPLCPKFSLSLVLDLQINSRGKAKGSSLPTIAKTTTTKFIHVLDGLGFKFGSTNSRLFDHEHTSF